MATFSSKIGKERPYRFNDLFDLIPAPSDNPHVPWIAADPTFENQDAAVEPLVITLKAGDTLYLPSMYFHQVSQGNDPNDGYCIAVNYWYDMNYGLSYGYYQCMEGLLQGKNHDEI